jgi:hypothetical protein
MTCRILLGNATLVLRWFDVRRPEMHFASALGNPCFVLRIELVSPAFALR